MGTIIKVLLSVMLLTSCNDNQTEVRYICNDVTITRVDKATETSFYYSTPQKRNAGRIWLNYSGIDSYFKVMLMFDVRSRKVVILSCDAVLKGENLDTTYFNFDRYNYEDMEINPFGVVNPDYKYTEFYTVIPSIRYEKERNLKTKTKVKAIYDNAPVPPEVKP